MSHRPPAEWVRELEAIGGAPSERQTWLGFYFWPGESWAVINRWSIWEFAPRGYLERTARYKGQFASVLEALQGPPPRSLRVYDGNGIFLRSDAKVTQEQWELFRLTGALARPFWVLQGSFGGHKVHFTQQESQVLKLSGLPSYPPAPGDLPPCPWDTRSRTALWVQRDLHDRALTLVPGRRFTEDSHLIMRKAREVDFRRHLLAWLKPQIAEGAQEMARPLGKAKVSQAMPTAPEVTDEEMEASEASFLNSTSTEL